MMSRPIRPTPRRGFTIVEMLVVLGIIVVIASMTVVVLGRARKSADKSRLGFQLQAIQIGLEAYQTEFNALPVTSIATLSTTDGDTDINANGLRGARTLCKALMGSAGGQAGTGTYVLSQVHQDGVAGLGFAVVGRSGVAMRDGNGNLKGRIYKPFLAADKFPISRTDEIGAPVAAPYSATEKYDDTAVLLDGNGNPILYYPVLNPQPNIAVARAFIGDGLPGATLPMYRRTDNAAWLNAEMFHRLLGDVRQADGEPGPDGAISSATAGFPAETAAVRGKYILYSAGPDGLFGPNAKDLTKTDAQKLQALDDVTNFQGN